MANGTFTAVNLSQLPAPQVVEVLSFEDILQERIDYLVSLYPAGKQDSIRAGLALESDPRRKLLEENAYREIIWRSRVNQAAKSVMLAYAQRSDLDNIGANTGVTRLVIQEADATTIPPTPLVMESDDDFRYRIQLAPEAFTTAGSEGSYQYHTRSADGSIRDAFITSYDPGVVTVYVSSRNGNGQVGEAVLDLVRAALNKKTVRPLTDQVLVMSAAPVEYTVSATLQIYDGPDPAVVINAARAAVREYVDNQRKIGYDITTSGLIGALQQPGVHKTVLVTPAQDVVIDDSEVGYCTAINITQVPLNV